MKLSKPVKLAFISAVTIGAGLGAFGIVHAAISTSQSSVTPTPQLAAPKVEHVSIDGPAPVITPEPSDAPAGQDPADQTAPAELSSTPAKASTPAPSTSVAPQANYYKFYAGQPVPITTPQETTTPAPLPSTDSNVVYVTEFAPPDKKH